MKKLLVISALCLASVSNADPSIQSKSVICDSTQGILNTISSPEFAETHSWSGIGNDTQIYLLFTNVQTGTWSLLQTITQDQSCILGSGIRSLTPPIATDMMHVQD